MSAAVIGIAVPCALAVLVPQHTMTKIESRNMVVSLLSPFVKDIVGPFTLSSFKSLSCLGVVNFLWPVVESISTVFCVNVACTSLLTGG